MGYVCLLVYCFLYLPLFPQTFKLWHEFEPNLPAKKRSKNSEVPVEIINKCSWIDILLIPLRGIEFGVTVKDLTLRKVPF